MVDGMNKHSLTMFLAMECDNASEIRRSVLQGEGTTLPEAALIDASLILDPIIVRAAGGMAWQQHTSSTQELKSRTLHSELVFCLSGSKHIGRSLATFGIKDDTKNLLVAMFDASTEDIDTLKKCIHGRMVTEEDAIRQELLSICDEQAVRKAYKVSEEELEVGSMTEAILCRIAARDCI